jgi:hypothetical protein
MAMKNICTNTLSSSFISYTVITSTGISLKWNRLGLVLIFLGLVAGGIVWAFLVSLRFWYLVSNVPGKDIGEPIWILDPEFTLIAAVPGLLLALYGFYVAVIEENRRISNTP